MPYVPASSRSPIELIAERKDISASHRKIAGFIERQPFRAAMMGIEELAAAANVSVATVNRFVRRLGFAGYSEFRGAAQRPFHGPLTPVEKLRRRKAHPTAADELMREAYRGASANIARSERLLIPEAAEAAVAALLSTPRVIVVANGIAAPLALLVGDLLEPYCAVVEVLDGRGGAERMIRRVMRVGKGDVLVALTLPRYSRITLDLLRAGRDQGALTIGLTDGPNSPITPFCEITLFGAAEHGVLHGSCIGLLAVAEALASVLAQRQQTVEDAAELTQRIRPHLFEESSESRARR
jgi:DNA-binding MurR/RpiR family transcriptional regulator